MVRYNMLTPQERWNKKHRDILDKAQHNYWYRKRAKMSPLAIQKYNRKYCLVMRKRRKGKAKK